MGDRCVLSGFKDAFGVCDSDAGDADEGVKVGFVGHNRSPKNAAGGLQKLCLSGGGAFRPVEYNGCILHRISPY